jgi:hypothetical protein
MVSAGWGSPPEKTSKELDGTPEVRKTTRDAKCGQVCTIFWYNASPSISGIWRSVRMRAKLRSLSKVNASLPFPADSTRCPKADRNSTRKSRMCGASSTPKDAMNHNLDLLGCGIILAADISGLEVSQDSAPGDEELGTTLLCGHGKWFVD